MTAPATLLLAHSLPHVMMMWRTLLSPHCGRYYIEGEATTTAQMLYAAATLQPAVVLMDAGMAGKCLASTVQQLLACAANARLLICWRYHHEGLVQQIPGLPVAYLAEDVQPWEVLMALNQLMRGNTYHCRQSERALGPPAVRKPLPEKYPQLLWGMWESHSAKDMADVTGLTENTVKF
jgi:DNA-binding NarL/FixJ family response regulator